MADLGTPSASLGAAIVAQVDASIGTDWKVSATFAAVAQSGSYTDLINRPTLGTASAENVEAFASAAQGARADTAIQPADLATVATTGAYSSLTGTPVLSIVATTGSYADLNGLPTLGTAAAEDASAFATAAQGALADTAPQPGDLANVATSGAYSDLTGTPTLGTAADNDEGDFATAAQGLPTGGTTGQILAKIDGTNYNTEWIDAPSGGGGGGAVDSVNGQTGTVVLDADDIDDSTTTNKFATAAQLAAVDSAVQPGDLATVATSGAYGDLTGLPTLGTAADNDEGDFATSAQGALADSAVQPGDLATVATTGDYDDLVNKPATDADTILTTARRRALATAANA